MHLPLVQVQAGWCDGRERRPRDGHRRVAREGAKGHKRGVGQGGRRRDRGGAGGRKGEHGAASWTGGARGAARRGGAARACSRVWTSRPWRRSSRAKAQRMLAGSCSRGRWGLCGVAMCSGYRGGGAVLKGQRGQVARAVVCRELGGGARGGSEGEVQ